MDLNAGYCLGLAVHWIVLRLNGRDYAYSDNRALSPSFTTEGATDQATFAATYDKLVPRRAQDDPIQKIEITALNDALRPYRMKQWGSYDVNARKPEVDFFFRCAKTLRGPAIIVWRGSGGAHATALDARMTEGRFNYFDANFGHFQIAGHLRFAGWFNSYLAHSQYATAFEQVQAYFPIGIA